MARTRRFHLALGRGVLLCAALALVESCRWGYDLVDVSLPLGERSGNGDGDVSSSGGANAGRASMGGGSSMAGSDSLGGSDAGGASTGGTMMVATGPFGTATEIPGIAEAGSVDDDPSFPEDRLELFFSTERGTASEEIWVVKRDVITDPWGTPEPLGATINDGQLNAQPGVTSDGLTLYFVRGVVGDRNTRDLYVSQRAARDDTWGVPTVVSLSEPESPDGSPCGAFDGLQLAWARSEAGGGDLGFARRATPSDMWVIGTDFDNLNTGVSEGEPWTSDDGLHVVFRRSTPDNELYTSSRASTDEPFPPETALDSINTTWSESDPWLSQDMSYIVFVSSRNGSRRLFEASR